MNRVEAIDEEYVYEGSVIISQTDLKGVITYANKKFSEVSGYSVSELVGQPYNIVRHPEMPKATFARMWQTISSRQVWNGLVKNLRKDGLYYWVDIEILPILNDDNEVAGYISATKQASRKNIVETEELYNKMLDEERDEKEN